MDFPLFEMPWLGDRWLIGLVAILHVLVNHGAAIGGSVVVVWAERQGLKTGDARWDALAYRLAFVFFLLTTTVGAMSGVGIWFTTMVSQPAGIASLLRIFFWAWFVEWGVFVGEIALVMAYFLSWHHFRAKTTHLRLGYLYAGFSFTTLAIVTAILGAMLTPGRWLETHSFWAAYLNPTYLPQLLLRSGLALALAAAIALAAMRWLAPADFRADASRAMARFLIMAAPMAAVGGFWYLAVLPPAVRDLIPTALVTTKFASYVNASYATNALLGALVLAVGLWGSRRPLPLPRLARLAPLVAVVLLLGQFERVREFVRKPYLIHGYMYANGLRVDRVSSLNRTGILAQSPYAAVHGVTPTNHLLAGREVYRLECAACHTLGGANDLRAKVAGQGEAGIAAFVGVLHEVHPFMPPFVGSRAEREALAAYLHAEASPLPVSLTRAGDAP